MSHHKICLRTMQDYYAKNRVLPGFPAIGKLAGLPVGSSVPAMLARLKLTGYLAFTPEKYLSPTRRFLERRPDGHGFHRRISGRTALVHRAAHYQR
jgi:hypothetical protein